MTWWLLLAAAVLVAAAGGAGWWLRSRVLVVTVHGVSMRPTYTEGDRLLVRRATLAGTRAGDVVVLAREPLGDGLEFLVKRAAAVPGDPVPAGIPVPDRVVPDGRLVVLGDNAGASYDSRRAGYFDATDVVGVVVRELARRDPARTT